MYTQGVVAGDGKRKAAAASVDTSGKTRGIWIRDVMQ